MNDQPVTPEAPVEEPPATREETITDLLDGSKRDAVPLRRAFLQVDGHGGPLARLVRSHDGRALDLYLLLLAAASGGAYNVARAAGMWARVLSGDNAVSPAAVSKVLRRLEELKLISRRRKGRMADVTLLDESGSGQPYARPGKDGAKGHYIKLDYRYWREGWHDQLSLAAQAMLLIALAQKVDFVLPEKRASQWYGLSEDTIRKGLHELTSHGLLQQHWVWRKDPRSALGRTQEIHCRLDGPFKRKSPPLEQAAEPHREAGEVEWPKEIAV